MLDDNFYMAEALSLAKQAAEQGEIPVGALIASGDGTILSKAYNLRETKNSAIAHAEILAIEQACQSLGRWRLFDCTLYVTLEPCFMCAGAIVLARLPRVVYGAQDPKAGAVKNLATVLNDPRLNHQCQVEAGVMAEEAGLLLKEFFRARRR
jgi:tRNA(adenine34) deaminase